MDAAFVLLVLMGGSSLSGVAAFPGGKVTAACASMTPVHGSNAPMLSPPPFQVISSNSTYSAEQKITVTLQANGSPFKGFLLQARDAVTGDGPLGTFNVTGSEAQLLSCGGEATAVSHTSPSMKKTVQAVWTPPASEVRDIEFRATFVKNFTDFWVGVRSSRVMFAGSVSNLTTSVTPSSSPSPSSSQSVLVLSLGLLAFSNMS